VTGQMSASRCSRTVRRAVTKWSGPYLGRVSLEVASLPKLAEILAGVDRVGETQNRHQPDDRAISEGAG
jgi:hypothetical protein